jgi:hypothetical protein
MKLKPRDYEVRRRYYRSKPNQFGDLHEQMREAMEWLGKIQRTDIGGDPNVQRLLDVLCDLEIEVSYTEPSSPPMNHRTLDPNKLMRRVI